MHNQLSENLIHTMRQYLPKGENLAMVLMNTLSLGKEAAYRRLRGDIMFTFEDVAKISRKFGFSLDKIVGESMVLDNNKWAFIDVDTFYTSSGYMEQYKKRVKLFSDIFDNLSGQPQAIVKSAVNHLPFYFILPHKKLNLFRHYKRAYLSFGLNPEFQFADFDIPLAFREDELRLLEKYISIPKVLLLLGRNVFFFDNK